MRKLHSFSLATVIILLSWSIAALALDKTTFPGPLDTLLAMANIFIDSKFYVSILETLLISLAGLLFGLLLAYFVGIIISQNQFLLNSAMPSLNAIRAIPSIVLLPLALVISGSTYFSIVVITTYVVFAKLVIYTVDGMRSSMRDHSDLGRLCAMTRMQRFIFLEFPASARFVMTGLQLSSSRSYGTVILGGLFIGTPGLGQMLARARDMANFEQMFAYGFFLALVGILIYQLFISLERRAVVIWGL